MRSLPAAVLLLLATSPAQATTDWHTDFAAAQKLAADTHAPLFVTFRCER